MQQIRTPTSTAVQENESIAESHTSVLYEDDEIKVLWHPGNSDFLMVTFGDLVTMVNGDRFYADTPIRKLDLNCIGFMSKRPNWFPSKNVKASIPVIEPTIKRFIDRVIYGGSMGGHAAIKYSKALKATSVLAFCPQWSLDPVECEGNTSGYAQYFNNSMAGMGIKKDDVSGLICVIYDPNHKIDSFHYSKIKGLAGSVFSIRAFSAGHDVTKILAGTQQIDQMVKALRLRKFDQLVALASGFRKASPIRLSRLLHKSAARHPQILNKLMELSPRLQRIHPEEKRRLNNALISGFDAGGFTTESLQTVKRISERNPCTVRASILAEYQSRLADKETTLNNGVFNTHHKTFLVYSSITGTLRHLAIGEIDSRCLSHFYISRGKIFDREVASIQIGGKSFYCKVIANNEIALISADILPVDLSNLIDILQAGEKFTLMLNGKYLSTERNGNVSYSRDQVKDWEIFSISKKP
jgi:hypothetical protein